MQIDLGLCCYCERDGARNILNLPFEAPVLGTGWGCRDCGVPFDGAISVVCDACLDYVKMGLLPAFVCVGDIKNRQRGKVDRNAPSFTHSMQEHNRGREIAAMVATGGERRINAVFSELEMMASARMN